ncbi:hypothetical protein BGW36DRAFT_434002 [Talaromyces proteolyticus]|uniref:Uncharacterized protein n=1 Tax=Talaromyces proteolyticus TaxID=1131652 RepID=A0AAD4KCR0_9EURO|nr:uncharacterized protein BGW36DRAFT_434002 [Talaromyces proteolyticus]KAH8688703.1 hypothetical protein BGW36DRAFT_434002 [Talaromyces proteolyticus]
MGTPTRDTLIKLATNSGLTRDPSVPQGLNYKRKEEIEKGHELCTLKNRYDTLRTDLIARSERKRRYKAAEVEQHKSLFDIIRNQIIEGNYEGKPVTFEPDTSHVLPERRALTDLEFKNRDVDKVSYDELLEDRIRSLEMRLALYHLEVLRKLQERIRFNKPPPQKTEDDPISMESEEE